jgi:hypothetical protein
MFTKQFGANICDGDAIECKAHGFTFVATVHVDDHPGKPWENEDGHGDVTEWTTRNKRPGELILAKDRDARRYYDFAGAVAKAKAGGWNAPPYDGSRGERAVRAVRADFEHLKAWCDDEWQYVGVGVVAVKNGIRLTGPFDCSVWGIESTAGEHLTETANELLDDALSRARKTLANLCDCAA